MDQREASDRVEIRELSARYIQAIDAYDIEACLATLTEDGYGTTLDAPWALELANVPPDAAAGAG